MISASTCACITHILRVYLNKRTTTLPRPPNRNTNACTLVAARGRSSEVTGRSGGGNCLPYRLVDRLPSRPGWSQRAAIALAAETGAPPGARKSATSRHVFQRPKGTLSAPASSTIASTPQKAHPSERKRPSNRERKRPSKSACAGAGWDLAQQVGTGLVEAADLDAALPVARRRHPCGGRSGGVNADQRQPTPADAN